jgi:hypothetical protein
MKIKVVRFDDEETVTITRINGGVTHKTYTLSDKNRERLYGLGNKFVPVKNRFNQIDFYWLIG